MVEGQTLDKKSIRIFTTNPDKWSWRDIAADCVAFANAQGGKICFGIEDNASLPPAGQCIPEGLADRLRKGVAQHTHHVAVMTELNFAPNNGQFLVLTVLPNQKSVAATSDARYFIRVADETRRLYPEDLVRLVAEKDSYQWETQIVRRLSVEKADPAKVARFLREIHASERVKAAAKQRSDLEILEHYLLVSDGCLTHLGVLWLGQRQDRAQLLHAPTIQFLKYDARGERVAKLTWTDYSLNPQELIEAIWTEIPDWRESTELPDGLFRKIIPHYDEIVVRELVANALVHRPYTTRGDIFINLYPDALEIHNPGSLPLGVTPTNILQKTVRRNNHLAQIFHDLKLMEREGTGYDRIYETQLAQAKSVPQVREEDDRVAVRVERRILKPELIDLLARADQQFGLSARERIALGLIAQHGSLTALEFGRLLQIEGDDRIRVWLGTLPVKGVVLSRGQTRATEYFIAPDVLRSTQFKGPTTLKAIAPHRLEELIRADLALYPNSGLADLLARIGSEIPVYKVKRMLEDLRHRGVLRMTGQRRWAQYSLAQSLPNKPKPTDDSIAKIVLPDVPDGISR
jgi:ATP-dependent DNA helicase RecG